MKSVIPLILAALLLLGSCDQRPDKAKISMENLYAWCIVPFDSLERTPAERIAMLKRLGITKYAYDWRTEHLNSTAQELELARDNHIEVNALWLWIDDNWDSVGKLNESNERLFEIIEEAHYQGQIWVSFHANYFENLTDEAALAKGVDMIGYLSNRAKALSCKIALYNHGDWFGEPEDQVKIIKALPQEELGIIYNFHHAHHQIDAYPQLVSTMMPYLWSVNLNGLRREGPKILTLGEGDFELEFVETLIEAGYTGDFGILGHVEDADVEVVLEANLNGLKSMLNQ